MTFKSLALISGFFLSLNAIAATDNNTSKTDNVSSVEWSADVDTEAFWLSYAESKGGLTWGRGTEYPEYEKVKEGDTLLIEVKQGPCLMEFFHSRWRRANDVRRWDESVNNYGGCPHVFD